MEFHKIIVCFLLLSLTSASLFTAAFEFPTVERISDIFSSLKDNQDIPSHDLKYKNSCDKTSESCQGTPHKKTKKKSKRTKRQAAEIGDESPLPYEVKSSALV